jgi:hypothetical protein
MVSARQAVKTKSSSVAVRIGSLKVESKVS